jgi:hypothetical protein
MLVAACTIMMITGEGCSSDEENDPVPGQIAHAGMSNATSSTFGAATPIPSPLLTTSDSNGRLIFELNVPIKKHHQKDKKRSHGPKQRRPSASTADSTVGHTPVISGASTPATPSHTTPLFAFFGGGFASANASHTSEGHQQHSSTGGSMAAAGQHQQGGSSDKVRAGRLRRSSAPPVSEGMGAVHGLGHALGRMAHWVSGTLLPPLTSHGSSASASGGASDAAAVGVSREVIGSDHQSSNDQDQLQGRATREQVLPPSPAKAIPFPVRGRPPAVPARSPTSVDQSKFDRSKFDHQHPGRRPLSAALTTIVHAPMRLATRMADALSVSRGSTSTMLSSTSGTDDHMQVRMQGH